MIQQQAKQRFERALKHQSDGNLAAAIELYEELLKSFPNRASLLINLSAIYIELRNNKKLDTLLPQLMELENATAFLNAGTINFLKGNKNLALNCFEKALLLEPTNTKILQSISFCLFKLKKPAKAAEHAKKLALLTNNGSDWGRARYYYGQACDWEKEKMIDPDLSNYPFFDIARNISEKSNFESAKVFIEQSVSPVHLSKTVYPMAVRRKNDQINLAYLSGEFREHATLKLLISVLEFHNTERFKNFLFRQRECRQI